MSMMHVLPYGTLPTRSYFALAARHEPGASSKFSLMQDSLRRHGPNQLVLQMLQACGFTWAPLVGCGCGQTPCLCTDVAAVADALESPALPSSVAQHGVASTEGVHSSPSTTGVSAGGSPKRKRKRPPSAREVEREFYGDVLGED